MSWEEVAGSEEVVASWGAAGTREELVRPEGAGRSREVQLLESVHLLV